MSTDQNQNVVPISKRNRKKLSNKLYNAVYNAALKDDEVGEDGKVLVDAIIAKGVGKGYAFAPDRLAPYKKDIVEVILQMDERFFRGSNGNQNGGLVILLQRDMNGAEWTEGDIDIEHLICLSIALELGQFCQPREKWLEMPFFVFNGTRDYFKSLMAKL